MSEKKLVDRTVVIGTVILCVALLIGLVGAVITYTAMLDAKDSIIASKDLQIADRDSQISDMQEMVDEKQFEIDDLNSQISQKNLTISDLNEQVSQKNSQISSLNSQISQKKSAISSLNSQVSALEDQKDALISQVSSLNSQIASLENEKNSLSAQVSSLNSQIANLESSIISLTSQIETLNLQIGSLQETYDNYVAAYQSLRAIINQRADHVDISSFIAPLDYQVVSIVASVTGGWSDTSDFNEFWTDVKALYSWIRTNIDYRSDGLSPLLPFNPANDPYYSTEMWQFPSETLSLGKGDCEDQAILLCSMIRCYHGMVYPTQCVWITSSSAAHVGVQIPVSGGKLVIFDPAGNYYSSNLLGSIVFNDVSVEINNWLDYWKSNGIGSDVYVYRVFSDNLDLTFSSTSEYLSWMYS